jgi:hypothetical protein
MLITSWTDPRLAIKTAPAMTLYGTDVFDKGLIWGPRLTFANRRDLTNPIDGVVRSYNTGRVEVVQRYLSTYAMNLNMRDFPFDTQKFTWNIRSTTHNKSVLTFLSMMDLQSLKNSSLQLQSLLDPTFSYSNYNQTTYTVKEGIFKDFHLLSVSLDAKRLTTMSSIFLIFPICILCSALCLVFSQEPSNNSRLSLPLGCITSCLAFSYVVSNQCPPVSYTTRIHLMIFFTYIVSVITMVFNYYLWAIELAKKELGRLNGEKKNLLMDAHLMPRKIGNTPSKVIVMPRGVHKPPLKDPENDKSKTGGIGPANQQILASKSKDLVLVHRAPEGTQSTLTSSPRRSAWETEISQPEQAMAAPWNHESHLNLPGIVEAPNEIPVMTESVDQDQLPHINEQSLNPTPLARVKPSGESLLSEFKEQNEMAINLQKIVQKSPILSYFTYSAKSRHLRHTHTGSPPILH